MNTTPVHQQLREAKGRGNKMFAKNLTTDQIVRVDGVKYAVQANPTRLPVTGSIAVEVYSQDNQHDTLYLSASALVPVLGQVTR